MVRSRRTSVREVVHPQLDRYHETRTKQAISRPRQWEQSALQPPADAPTDSDFRQQRPKRKDPRQRVSGLRTLCCACARSSDQRRPYSGRKLVSARGALFSNHECQWGRRSAWGAAPDDAGRFRDGQVGGGWWRDERNLGPAGAAGVRTRGAAAAAARRGAWLPARYAAFRLAPSVLS